MKIINNTTEKLADDLRVTIKKRSRVSMAAACFSVYAFEELKAQLENLDELRFIFTSPAFLDEKPKKAQREFYIPRLNRERTLHGSEFEIKLRSEFRQRAISQECAHWIREKARFKSNKTMEGMTGFLTVDSDSPVAYAPVNGFTREDLGCDRGGRMFSMINRVDAPESKAYLELFDQLWNDQSHLKDVTDKVLESITTAYQENSPEFLYFYALYNIFGSFLEQVNITYNRLDAAYDQDVFTRATLRGKLDVNAMEANRSLYSHVIYDSDNERRFAQELDVSDQVAVYVKLPGSFYISTPVGKYNPDWAIAFNEGSVKHIYFVAETKGNLDTMELRGVENAKIEYKI